MLAFFFSICDDCDHKLFNLYENEESYKNNILLVGTTKNFVMALTAESHLEFIFRMINLNI